MAVSKTARDWRFEDFPPVGGAILKAASAIFRPPAFDED
jgi:hypothetical protein